MRCVIDVQMWFINKMMVARMKNDTPLLLILDQINDVRNFGAIIRTAEVAGVTAVVIQNSSSAPINSDTIKTSAGAIFNIPICKVNHIKDAIYHFKSLGISIVSASEKSDKNLYNTDFKKPVAIVMGSENKGINKSVLKISDVWKNRIFKCFCCLWCFFI